MFFNDRHILKMKGRGVRVRLHFTPTVQKAYLYQRFGKILYMIGEKYREKERQTGREAIKQRDI